MYEPWYSPEVWLESRLAVPLNCKVCEPFVGATDAVSLPARAGFSVKPFPWPSVSDADLTTTLQVTLLPELMVTAPRLTVEGTPAAFVPSDRSVTASDEALIDSITSAVTSCYNVFEKNNTYFLHSLGLESSRKSCMFNSFKLYSNILSMTNRVVSVFL